MYDPGIWGKFGQHNTATEFRQEMERRREAARLSAAASQHGPDALEMDIRSLVARKPLSRPGYRWEYRHGCQCINCLWGEHCIGRAWPHWAEVKE